MKELTTEQAMVLFAFLECNDLCSGNWQAIEKMMQEGWNIEDPETALEDAKMALQ